MRSDFNSLEFKKLSLERGKRKNGAKKTTPRRPVRFGQRYN